MSRWGPNLVIGVQGQFKIEVRDIPSVLNQPAETTEQDTQPDVHGQLTYAATHRAGVPAEQCQQNCFTNYDTRECFRYDT
jgi:hypothetical protein